LLILLPAVICVAALLAVCVWVEGFLPDDGTGPALLHESWDVLSIEGVRVGGSHQRQWQMLQQGQPRIVTEADESLRVLRQGQAVHLEVTYRCEETLTGEMLSCRSRQQTGAGPPVVQTGQVRGGRLLLKQQVGNDPTERTIDWPTQTHGYFGIEASLQHQMLVPGERRNLQYLVPLLNQLGQCELHATGFETVELASGLIRLLRIEATIHRAGTTTHRTLWCDGAGEVILSLEPALNLTSERTTREVAQWQTPSPHYDIMARSLVPIDPPIEAPHDQAKLVYQVQLQRNSPMEVFASDDRQQVKPLGPQRALLTVHAAWLNTEKGTPLPAERRHPPATPRAQPAPAPEPAALAASRFIQSDDPRIIAFAGRVLPGQETADQDTANVQPLAVGLEKLVHNWINENHYQQIFASAREVFESRRGDCTEHAVLLAAVCRARKIPARLVVGLVYVPSQQGFLFHLWTEGWWAGRWHGLDATLGRGGIGATYLKLHAFTLADDNMLAEMTAVSQVIGQLEIHLVEQE